MNLLRTLFGQVLEVSLAMSPVILLLLALRPLLGKRYRARTWYWAWLLVCLRLAVPLNVSLPQAPVRLTVPDPTLVYARQAPERPAEGLLPQPGQGQAVPAQKPPQLPAAAPAADSASRTVGEGAAPPAPAAYAPALTLAQLAGLVWAAGAGVFLTVHLAGYAASRRRVRRWRRTCGEGETLSRFRTLAEELGLENVSLGICPGLPSPLATGLFRPELLLPREDCGGGLDAILRHELVHIRRRDLWYKLLLLLVRTVHWFHPLVHLMARRAERDLEISCDEAVVAGRGSDFQAQYGHAVLDAAQRGLDHAVPLTSQFKGGKGALKERIWTIAGKAGKRRGTAVVCAVALLAAVVAGACSVTGEVEDQVLYATYNITDQDVEDDSEEGVFRQMDYDPATGALGEELGTLTLSFAQEVTVKYAAQEGREEKTIGMEGSGLHSRRQELFSFLAWPALRSTIPPGRNVDLLKLTLSGGKITAMEWLLVPDGDQTAPSAAPLPSAVPTASPTPEGGEDFPAIPLGEYELSVPVPEFLSADQQLLYRRAFGVYSHLFGGETFAVEDWERDEPYPHPGSYETFWEGDTPYTLSQGRYADWEDFDAMVHSVFTQEFFHNRNRSYDGNGKEVLTFREHEGQLAFIDASIGSGAYRNDNFPDTFELIEQTDDLIRFYVVGYYSYPYPVGAEVLGENSYDFDARDARLAAGYEYTDRWELRMVRTDGGWRFDSFANTWRDEADYHGIYLEVGQPRYTVELRYAMPGPDYTLISRYSPVLLEGESFLGGFAPKENAAWQAHEMTLTSLREELSGYREAKAEAESFALCDMDGDGEREVLLHLDDPGGTYLVLHREGERFYGVLYYIRWLEELQTNGLYMGSGGAATHYYYRLRFEDGAAVEELLANCDGEQYWIAGEKVSAAEFADWEEENRGEEVTWLWLK